MEGISFEQRQQIAVLKFDIKKESVERYRGVTVDVFFFRVEQGFMGCLVLKNYWRIKNLQEFNVKECMQAW